MTDLLLSPMPAAAPAATAPSPAETKLRAKIAATSKEFESQFLSVMMGQMMKGVGEKGAFGGGGEGEAAFKSFMTDAFAKAISGRGGIGLAKEISKSMLHLQGLS
jgi:Rod binding domain-containing protein